MKTCNDAPVGYTDHPPVGHWVEWHGGDCPVHPLATLDYQMCNGQRCVDTADQLDWSIHGDDWDVVRFCILEECKPEPEKVPLEFWLSMCTNERSPDPVEGWLHVREVLE